jgi:hypothetical protein
MLHKCANPACAVRFRNLGRGKLFQIESEYLEASGLRPSASGRRVRALRRVERYWLCDECASSLTLTFDQNRGVVTVPLPDVAKPRVLTALRLQPLQSSAPTARTGGSRWEMRGATWTI